MIGLSLQSSAHIRQLQSPTVKKFLTKAVLRCKANTGPKWAWYRAIIFSMGFLPFLLPEITIPCSVPTMNLVGIVDSYSRQDAPSAFERLCSSRRQWSRIRLSRGLLIFLVSHLQKGAQDQATLTILLLPVELSISWGAEKLVSRLWLYPQHVMYRISVTDFWYAHFHRLRSSSYVPNRHLSIDVTAD